LTKAEQPKIPKDLPDTSRKALRDYLNSTEGAAWVLQSLKDAADQVSVRSIQCPTCKRRFDATVPDNGARVRAIQTMHEYSVGKPEKDTEAVDSSKRLQDMTEAEREALRAQLYAKLGNQQSD
jgi:hypothetical protein